MTIEMTPNKFVDLCLGQRVEVLEFVHGLKLDNVETVGKDAVYDRGRVVRARTATPFQQGLRTRLPLQQMFTLESGDMADGRKDIGTMC